MLSQSVSVTIEPEQVRQGWRLVGKFHRHTHRLLALAAMPPGAACPANAREYYCLLMLNGSLSESLQLRGVNDLNRPLTWTFDTDGQEIGWA